MRDALRYRATTLNQVMTNQGRKIEWLAGRIGVSGSFISRVIHGERTISHSHASMIATLLGVPVSLLFERVPDPQERSAA